VARWSHAHAERVPGSSPCLIAGAVPTNPTADSALSRSDAAVCAAAARFGPYRPPVSDLRDPGRPLEAHGFTAANPPDSRVKNGLGETVEPPAPLLCVGGLPAARRLQSRPACGGWRCRLLRVFSASVAPAPAAAAGRHSVKFLPSSWFSGGGPGEGRRSLAPAIRAVVGSLGGGG
jgi:hypothetical protein